MTKLILPIFLVLLLPYFSQSQDDHDHSRCASSKYLEDRLANDPIFRANFDRWTANSAGKVKKRSALGCDANNSVIIPVAVHYDGNVDCSNFQCLIDAAEAQIAVLNETFSASNADLTKYTEDLNGVCAVGYPLSYAPVAGQGSCIQFCLASHDHPAVSGLAEGEPAITIRQYGWPTAGSDWAGYLNIFVSDITPAGLSAGTLGVSPVPGSANGDGFWVRASSFGGPDFSCVSGMNVNTNTVYDLGKTAVHEAGHYFGLHHTFRSGCEDGDKNPPVPNGFSLTVEDTPPEAESFSGCPGAITSCNTAPKSCTPSAFEPFWNYMDYTYDDCMYMFTEDQCQVMNAWANTLTWKSDVTACQSTSFTSLTCPCLITDLGLTVNACTGNTFTFSLNPTGDELGSTYSVTGSTTGSDFPLGSATLFNNGGAGFPIGTEIEITVTAANGCSASTLFYAPCVATTCANAVEIDVDECTYAPGPTTGEGATNTTGPNGATHANWFKFTAPSSGTIEIHSCGQMVDTRLWVYSGSCNDLMFIDSSDNGCDRGDGNAFTASTVQFSATGGTTYFVEWDDSHSSFDFSFYVYYEDDAHSTCATAENLAGNGVILCSGPDIPGGQINNVNPEATSAYWYRFDATSDGFMDIFSCGYGVDTRFKLYTGSCAGLTFLGFSDDACDTGSGLPYASGGTGIAMSAGTTYYIEWDNVWSAYGFKWEFEAYGDCENYVDLGTGTLTEPEYEAGIQLKSQNTIASDVEMRAGQEILLEHPFQVMGGAMYHAYIAACVGLRIQGIDLNVPQPFFKIRPKKR